MSVDPRLIMTTRRRELRQRSTLAEKQLWIMLRRFRSIGYSFRRQHSIGWYIADFYCIKARLVIEIDGPIHEELAAIEYDRVRDEFMNSKSIKVLRLKNHEITDDPSKALLRIRETLDRLT